MTARLSDKKIVNGKPAGSELLDFCVEYQGFFSRREFRSAVSEEALRQEIDTKEPWRPPYTVTRVWTEAEIGEVA